jgi:hypothetical protein
MKEPRGDLRGASQPDYVRSAMAKLRAPPHEEALRAVFEDCVRESKAEYDRRKSKAHKKPTRFLDARYNLEIAAGWRDLHHALADFLAREFKAQTQLLHVERFHVEVSKGSEVCIQL